MVRYSISVWIRLIVLLYNSYFPYFGLYCFFGEFCIDIVYVSSYSIRLGKTFIVLNFLGDIPVIRLKKRVNEDGVEKFSS